MGEGHLSAPLTSFFRGARCVVVMAMMLASPGAIPFASQSSPDRAGERLHGAAIRSERIERLQEAWTDAPPEFRSMGEHYLVERRKGGALGRWPTALEASVCRRLLSEGDAGDDLARFADSLDLRVVPGFFEESSGGEQIEMRVKVSRAYATPEVGPVVLTLFWRSPVGVLTQARREPFRASAFRGEGFEMFIRAPVSKPGQWWLVPELAAHDRSPERADGEDTGERDSTRGIPVLVECVSSGFPSILYLDLSPLGTRRMEALSLRGLRAGDGFLPSEWMGRTEESFPACLRETQAGELAPGLIGGFPGSGKNGAVVLLAARDGGPASAFAGPAGRAWRRFSVENGVGLFAGVLDLSRSDPLLDIEHAVQRTLPGARIVLVARGASLAPLGLAAIKTSARPAGVLLSSPDPRLAIQIGGAPTWVAAPLGDERPGTDPPWLIRSSGHPIPVLTDPALPAVAAQWLEGIFHAGSRPPGDQER